MVEADAQRLPQTGSQRVPLLLALRFFRRDLRSAHFAVIGLAVLIAVASTTSVGTFTGRVRAALAQQSHALLAADLALQSTETIAPGLREQARAAGLATSEFAVLRTMLGSGDALQLAELKAVAEGYPLRGTMRVRSDEHDAEEVASDIPAPGEAWVEPRLLPLLHIKPGDLLQVGASRLRVTRLLVLEPDRAGEFFAIAPRVLINLADLPATALIAPGSRVQYALLLAGKPSALARFQDANPPGRHARFISPSDARPEIRAALTHAEQFLGLAALTATTLAGIAILLAARGFAVSRFDLVALLRTCGASRGEITALVLGELLLLALLASALGALLGVGFQAVLSGLLHDWTQTQLPPASWGGAARGFLAGFVAVGGFALAPLLGLRQVPPARILRQDLGVPGSRTPAALLQGGVAVVLLAPWDSGDWRLTAWALVGFLVVFAMLAGTGFLLVRGMGALRGRTGLTWRAGLANLARRPRESVWQISALGLGIMALLLLTVLRTDLLTRWRESLPPATPDQFLINIQPSQVDALATFLRRQGVTHAELHPMVRGRLVKIGEREVNPDSYTDPSARRLVDREFNLSWADRLKSDNRVTAGAFWEPGAGPQFSVETDLARRLDIRLGDRLTFSVAAQEVTATVTSLRAVSWDSMQVNFFVLAPPELLAQQPATYITSFHLPASAKTLLRELVQAFPNVTAIDVGAMLTQVRAIIARVSAAVQFVFLFTLAAGLVVLVAALKASEAARLRDAVILKTLGAPRAVVARIAATEFVALGLAAGLVGGLGAAGAGWLIATRVLHIAFNPVPAALLTGMMLGVLAILGVGLHAMFGVWREPVANALRRL